jgi:hypothetical protein
MALVYCARGVERQLDQPALRTAAADALVLGHVRLDERDGFRVILAGEGVEGFGEMREVGAGVTCPSSFARFDRSR